MTHVMRLDLSGSCERNWQLSIWAMGELLKEKWGSCRIQVHNIPSIVFFLRYRQCSACVQPGFAASRVATMGSSSCILTLKIQCGKCNTDFPNSPDICIFNPQSTDQPVFAAFLGRSWGHDIHVLSMKWLRKVAGLRCRGQERAWKCASDPSCERACFIWFHGGDISSGKMQLGAACGCTQSVKRLDISHHDT